jgi:DNA-binding NarL/FixJ family response regulator
MASLLVGDDIISTDDPARVLVVASSEEAQSVEEALREYRDLVKVDTCHDMQSGLAEARSGTHDVVLLTLELPDAWPADGYVRLQGEVEELPILVIASSEDEARLATRMASRAPFCMIERGSANASLIRRLIVSAILFKRAGGRPS